MAAYETHKIGDPKAVLLHMAGMCTTRWHIMCHVFPSVTAVGTGPDCDKTASALEWCRCEHRCALQALIGLPVPSLTKLHNAKDMLRLCKDVHVGPCPECLDHAEGI